MNIKFLCCLFRLQVNLYPTALMSREVESRNSGKMETLKDFEHHHHHHHHHLDSLVKKKKCCTCSSIFRRLPLALVISSFLLLCITAFFKWMALDWVVDHQIAQVSQYFKANDVISINSSTGIPGMRKSYYATIGQLND